MVLQLTIHNSLRILSLFTMVAILLTETVHIVSSLGRHSCPSLTTPFTMTSMGTGSSSVHPMRRAHLNRSAQSGVPQLRVFT